MAGLGYPEPANLELKYACMMGLCHMARTRTEILRESADLNFRLAKEPKATPDERELFLEKAAEDLTLAHFIRQDRRMN